MAENLTESSLDVKDSDYWAKYSNALNDFQSRSYSPEQFDLNSNPVHYIKICSIDKITTTNPALAIREQMQKALMALWSVGMRFHMIVHHHGSSVSVYVGTVCCRSDFSKISALKDILSGSIAGITFEVDKSSQDLLIYSFNKFYEVFKNQNIGSFFGNPIVCDLLENGNNVSPLDEIISGSEGRDWILCISAEPVAKCETMQNRANWYSWLAKSSRYTNVSFGYNIVGNNRSMNVQEQFPGTRLYNEFAQKNCNELDEAMQCGQWRVGAFCAALDNNSRNILGGLFSAHMKNGTERIERPFPFEYRTNSNMKFNVSLQMPHKNSTSYMSTRELTMLSALPIRDTCGFNVAERVEFDVYRENSGNLSVGKIVNGRNITAYDYRIDLNSLNRHGLIIGLTGGGKTNTVKSLLYSFHQLGCPFMVIEPAKKEYYEIHNMGISNLRIYSVGSSEGMPLYINPFEIAQIDDRRVSLQSHIDAVFAAFKASFIMYTPMPYVLENAIYAIYDDYGWDPATDENRFGRTDYPTIEDLYYKIGPVVREMGYDEKMQNDLIGSLKARINSLRVGAKGRTLNTANTVNMEELLNSNVVVELDDINDEDAKAFIISLLLLNIQECRKVQLTSQLKVQHILLIEEAHRLLKNVSSGTGESADPRGNAVEFFCNMLAELRSKGQGFLVIDQSPAKLAPDLIKNTNLKLIHRTVAGEDRHLVGSAMNMTESQEAYLSCLKQGYAAIYSEGDNHPKMVKLPYAGDYDRHDLDRIAILHAIARNRPAREMDVLGFIDQSRINPICRHCRKCQHWLDPEQKLKADPALLVVAKNTFDLVAHEALKAINKAAGNSEYRMCAFAAWFKANEAGCTDYSNYSRVLDFVIRALYH